MIRAVGAGSFFGGVGCLGQLGQGLTFQASYRPPTVLTIVPSRVYVLNRKGCPRCPRTCFCGDNRPMEGNGMEVSDWVKQQRATKRRRWRTLLRPPWEPQCLCERRALRDAPDDAGGKSETTDAEWFEQCEQNEWRRA